MFKREVSLERTLVLLLSRPFSSSEDIKSLQSDFKHSQYINWETVYNYSVHNEVSGLMYRNSSSLNLLPMDLVNRFQTFYNTTSLANILALKELLGILKILSVEGVKAIPLKGVFATDQLFDDFGVYPSSDIDLLVPLESLNEAKKILVSKFGYSVDTRNQESDLLENHYHLILQKQMSVEIHWNLVKKRYFKIPEDFWWESARIIEWENIRAYDLSPENNTLYLVFRLFDHCFNPLRFFVLLSAHIRKYQEAIDWDRLLQTADHYNMKKLVVYTLRVTWDLLGNTLPESTIGSVGCDYHIFKKMIISGIFSGVERKHLRMMIYTMMLIEPKAIVKVYWGRIFPTLGELRLRYNLPPSSMKVYAYYLLNPILLVLKKGGTGYRSSGE
jgi:hypothetical protein